MVHKVAKNKNFENSPYRIQTNSTFLLFVRGYLNIFIFTHFMGDNLENFSEKNQIFAKNWYISGNKKRE